MTILDRENYPSIGLAWWVVQTTTTVGYGDIVPTTYVGRLLAAFVMLVGIGFPDGHHSRDYQARSCRACAFEPADLGCRDPDRRQLRCITGGPERIEARESDS